MSRTASRAPFPGPPLLAVLLPLTGVLLIVQAASGGALPWGVFTVVASVTVVAGVVSAASAAHADAVAAADAARLDELEPLPPAGTGPGAVTGEGQAR
mgnify:CR=1 FL=1